MTNNEFQMTHEGRLWSDRQRRKIEYQERLERETKKERCPLCDAKEEIKRLRAEINELEGRISSQPMWIRNRI